MTRLPNRPRRAPGAALCCVLMLPAPLLAGHALAQDAAAPAALENRPSLTEQLLDPNQTPLARATGPRSLAPPSSVDEPVQSDLFAPATPDVYFPSGGQRSLPPVEPAVSLASRPGEEGTGIEVSRLSGLADDGIGLVGPMEGGLPPTLWAGSRRIVIEDGLAAMTPPPPSAALGSLFRRLLISRGELPQGASTGRSIIALRLDALYAAGFVKEVDALAALLPAGELTPETAAPAARAALALRDPDKACGYLTRLPTEGAADDVYAQFALELGALCQARAGLQMAALLSVDLVREQRGGDNTFVALATRAAGGPALKVPSDEIFTSLHYALVREAGGTLPANVADRAEPALLQALANDKSLSWDDRLTVGERASARGLMAPRDLAELYRQAIIEGAGNANPRVKAFAAAFDAPDPTLRLGVIAAAFAETPVELWPATIPAFGGSLRAIPPAMGYADHAVFMVEALALLGDAARADAWIGIATTSAPGQIARLEALTRIATPSHSSFALPWNPELALKSVDVRLANDGPDAKWLTAFEMQTLAALGLPVPQVIWAQFDDLQMPGVRLGDAPLRALRVAAEGKRMGEAAVAILNALGSLESGGGIGELGPWALTPGSLSAAITALSRGGLEADARALAVEALIVRAHGGA